MVTVGSLVGLALHPPMRAMSRAAKRWRRPGVFVLCFTRYHSLQQYVEGHTPLRRSNHTARGSLCLLPARRCRLSHHRELSKPLAGRQSSTRARKYTHYAVVQGMVYVIARLIPCGHRLPLGRPNTEALWCVLCSGRKSRSYAIC